MRSHPTETEDGRAALTAQARDPRVLSETLRGMARLAARRREAERLAAATLADVRADLAAAQARVAELEAAGGGAAAGMERWRVVDWLDDAAESIRNGVHLAEREEPDPAEVYRRTGALHALVVRLEQHLLACAVALEAVAERPELRAANGVSDPDSEARMEAFRLRDIAAGRYLRGLVTEVGLSHVVLSDLYLDTPAAAAAEGVAPAD